MEVIDFCIKLNNGEVVKLKSGERFYFHDRKTILWKYEEVIETLGDERYGIGNISIVKGGHEAKHSVRFISRDQILYISKIETVEEPKKVEPVIKKVQEIITDAKEEPRQSISDLVKKDKPKED